MQIDVLNQEGIALDLACTAKTAEGVLFAYNDFYVELVVEKYSDEILALKCFKSTRRLHPYLPQVDISQITSLLAC